MHPTLDANAWPVGKVTALLHVKNTLCATPRRAKHSDLEHVPPSVRRRVRQLKAVVDAESFKADLPTCRVADDLANLTPLWTATLLALKDPPACMHVDVSLSTHEDAMLRYDRKVPLCACGDACVARVYPRNQGPLPIYLPYAVEKARLAGGNTPPYSSTATCLLCIRRDVHACCLAWNAIVPDAEPPIRRAARIPPPFANLCGVPGGYIESVFATSPHHGVFGSYSVVGESGLVHCDWDPMTKAWFFDQSAIKWDSKHFLGRGATVGTQQRATDCRASSQQSASALETSRCTAQAWIPPSGPPLSIAPRASTTHTV